jgi:hypothetical protein
MRNAVHKTVKLFIYFNEFVVLASQRFICTQFRHLILPLPQCAVDGRWKTREIRLEYVVVCALFEAINRKLFGNRSCHKNKWNSQSFTST